MSASHDFSKVSDHGNDLEMPDALSADSSESDGSLSCVDTRDDMEWEDIESDVEVVTYKSLMDDQEFDDVHSMLNHCKTRYDLFECNSW